MQQKDDDDDESHVSESLLARDRDERHQPSADRHRDGRQPGAAEISRVDISAAAELEPELRHLIDGAILTVGEETGPGGRSGFGRENGRDDGPENGREGRDNGREKGRDDVDGPGRERRRPLGYPVAGPSRVVPLQASQRASVIPPTAEKHRSRLRYSEVRTSGICFH